MTGRSIGRLAASASRRGAAAVQTRMPIDCAVTVHTTALASGAAATRTGALAGSATGSATGTATGVGDDVCAGAPNHAA